MKDEQPLVATPSQTVGPFFHVALTGLPNSGMAGTRERAPGGEVTATRETARIRLRITVTDGDGQPVDDALVELWHAGSSAYAFGRMPTDKHGVCDFETVRAPHVNVCFFSRGLLRQLHTRIYFAGDPALADDPVLALVPPDRRDTLLARPDPSDGGRWLFDLRLQGTQETVFFDP